MTDTTTSASMTTVFGGLETLVTNALGNNESAAVKARVHATVTTLGALGTVLEPLLEDHVDVQGLVDGIQKVEDGAAALEEGIADVVAAIKAKKATASSSNTTSTITGTPKVD